MAQTSRSNPAIGGAVPTQYGIMLALARKIVNGEEEEKGESVEDAFAQARDAEAVSEELLVDEEWHAVEVEPETVLVEVLRNGASHVAVEAANGHDGEAGEPEQRSLFSWAEFMAEEPPKPSRKNGKPKPATLSMFEWALSLEQAREDELIGARR